MKEKLKADYGADIFQKVSVVDNIHKIKVPLLIIHDMDDKVVPIQDGRKIAQSWYLAQFIETAGLGHMKVLYAEEVVEKALNFIVNE